MECSLRDRSKFCFKAKIKWPDLIALSEYIKEQTIQASLIICSISTAKSSIELAPRGKLSIDSIKSLASLLSSIWKFLMI